ncbi:PIN domain-like protein, partial [Pilaira anomala]
MGIHGLPFFIKSHPTLIERVEWTKTDSKSDEFIFDGNAFVYYIAHENRTDWTHGGQYATIAKVVKDMVETFRQCGIHMIFLFDGSLPQDKMETRIKRHKSYIERSISTFWNLKQINTSNKNEEQRQNGIQYYGDLFLIPPMTLEVIIQTLRELEVDVKICQGEADSEVVALAKKKNGYVVSQDSDMHAYPDVGKGYIPFELLSMNQHGGDSHQISAGVFHPERLSRLLNLKRSFLPLFGTLLGNDYLDSDILRYPIGQWSSENGITVINKQNGWPKVVAEFIRRNGLNDEKDAIKNVVNQLKPIISKSSMKSREEKAAGFEDRIIDSISRYDADSSLIIHQE